MTTVHYSNLEDRYWIRDGEDRILWFDSVHAANEHREGMALRKAALEERKRIVAWLRAEESRISKFGGYGVWAAEEIEQGEYLK